MYRADDTMAMKEERIHQALLYHENCRRRGLRRGMR
jgi:hypothetical protein